MILVTGATGLVGAHLLAELIPHHSVITALYRSEDKRQQALSVLKYYGIAEDKAHEVIRWVKTDILDLVQLKCVFEGVTKVYHCAALVSFHKMDYPQLLRTNVEGTANVVNMCLRFGVDKLVHMSSVAALGDATKDGMVSEQSKWASYDGKSGYAVSKKHGEREVWRGIEEGLNAVIVNPTVIFGAAPLNQSSIAIFKTVLNGQRFYTTGSNAIVDARDVAAIMHQLMEREVSKQQYLLVGENVSFRAIMNEISDQAGKKRPSIGIESSMFPKAVRFIENVGKLFRIKPLLAYDSAVASISRTEYSNKKITDLLDYKFYNLKESVTNVLKYNGKLKS